MTSKFIDNYNYEGFIVWCHSLQHILNYNRSYSTEYRKWQLFVIN